MKNSTERQQIDYNKIVDFNKEEGTITVLDYVFNHGDSFKGATGSTFQMVSRSEYDERMDEENVIDQIIDVGVPPQFAQGGAIECYEAMVLNNEVEDFMFDLSYRELWDYLREELNLSEDEACIFECIGGGRCFDKDFQGNYNPELSAIIRKYES